MVDPPRELCYSTASTMMNLRRPRRSSIALAVIFAGALASRANAQSPKPAVDDVQALITISDSHFKAGQKELEQGHVDAAKAEFNLAIEVLLDSAYGGRTEPRIRDHF